MNPIMKESQGWTRGIFSLSLRCQDYAMKFATRFSLLHNVMDPRTDYPHFKLSNSFQSDFLCGTMCYSRGYA